MFVNNKLLWFIFAVSGYCYGGQPNINGMSQDSNITNTQQISDKQSNETEEEILLDSSELIVIDVESQQDRDKQSNETLLDSSEIDETSNNKSNSDILEKFKKGEYSYHVGQRIEVYNTIDSKRTIYCVYPLEGYGDCLGITIDSFANIVLECPGKKPEKPGCFDVFTSKTKPQNGTVVPVREVSVTCVGSLGRNCAGLHWKHFKITLSCSERTQSQNILRTMIHVGFNGRPPRY